MSNISHHGILGQKWGVQNGPPYPLNESAKSKIEKRHEKAEKRLQKAESSRNDLSGHISKSRAIHSIKNMSPYQLSRVSELIDWDKKIDIFSSDTKKERTQKYLNVIDVATAKILYKQATKAMAKNNIVFDDLTEEQKTSVIYYTLLTTREEIARRHLEEQTRQIQRQLNHYKSSYMY